MHPLITRRSTDLDALAIEQRSLIAQRLPEVSVRRQGGTRAVDVKLGIFTRIATVLGRQREQTLTIAVNGLGHLAQHLATLSERHRA